MTRRVCERAKSGMTPCYMKDGDVATYRTGAGSLACVGCERGIGLLHDDRKLHADGEKASETKDGA